MDECVVLCCVVLCCVVCERERERECVCVRLWVCASPLLCARGNGHRDWQTQTGECGRRTERNDKNLNRTLYKKRIGREKNRLIKDSTVKKKEEEKKERRRSGEGGGGEGGGGGRG